MNNARKTFNMLLDSVVTARLSGFEFRTGDEQNPELNPPSVIVAWLNGDDQGKRPESRMRLVQVTVAVGDQDTSGAENACQEILRGLGLHVGSRPRYITPKKDYTVTPAVNLATNIEVSVFGTKGWQRVDPPESLMRVYVITLAVDYTPD